MLAAMVSRSASFCAICRSSAAKLGLLFGRLANQKLPVHLDQHRARALGRAEVLKWIGSSSQRRTQSSDIKPGGDEVALEVVAFGLRHGRIELDQHVAGLDALPITDMDCANDAGLERLDNLGAPCWNNFARRGGDDVDAPKGGPNQR